VRGARLVVLGVVTITMGACRSSSPQTQPPTDTSAPTTTSFVDTNGTVPNPEMSEPFPADWVLDPSFALTPDTKSLHLIVTESQCASGLDPTGRIRATVEESPTEARVRVIVNSVGGAAHCQSNPPTPFVVQLSQPLGRRVVVDAESGEPVCGSCGAPIVVAGFNLTLPQELRFRTDGFVSSGEAIDAFYANVPLGRACTPGCGLASFSPLPPGAVVVGVGEWSGFGVGAPNPNDPAPNTSIAGHAALVMKDKPGNCGGDESITVRVPGADQTGINDFLMRACLQGPDLSAGERLVQMLLDSATGG
jgi:hypothetical protein